MEFTNYEYDYDHDQGGSKIVTNSEKGAKVVGKRIYPHIYYGINWL